MKLYRVYSGPGRAIVRANDAHEAKAIADQSAYRYWPHPPDVPEVQVKELVADGAPAMIEDWDWS